jgi:hypothetical protein
MSEKSLSSNRRSFLASSAAVGATALLATKARAAAEGDTIRPFRINVPEAGLVDLRRRIAATRWPDKETVNDASQGVQLAVVQKLARYWQTDYDWRKCEAGKTERPAEFHYRDRWA